VQLLKGRGCPISRERSGMANGSIYEYERSGNGEHLMFGRTAVGVPAGDRTRAWNQDRLGVEVGPSVGHALRKMPGTGDSMVPNSPETFYSFSIVSLLAHPPFFLFFLFFSFFCSLFFFLVSLLFFFFLFFFTPPVRTNLNLKKVRSMRPFRDGGAGVCQAVELPYTPKKRAVG